MGLRPQIQLKVVKAAMDIGLVGSFMWLTFQALIGHWSLALVSALSCLTTFYLRRTLTYDRIEPSSMIMVFLGWLTITLTGFMLSATTPELWMLAGVSMWAVLMLDWRRGLFTAFICQLSLIAVAIHWHSGEGIVTQSLFNAMVITASISLKRMFEREIGDTVFELSVQRQWTNAVLESLGDAVVTLDEEGRVLHCNLRARTLFGELAEPGEPLFADLKRYCPDFNPSEDGFRGVINLPQLSISAAISPISDPLPGAWTLVAQDRTEERRVNQLKEQFISSVNHELRTPLTSISGSIELLRQQNDALSSENRQKLLDIASRNTQRLADLVSDLLALSLSNNQQALLNKQPVNLKKLAKEACDSLSALANVDGVKLKVLGDDVMVNVDLARMSQLIINLVTNAIQFSPENKQVTVELKSAGSFVLLSVVDEGPGIPKKYHQQIFERFFQLDSSNGGTGIGLSLAKAVVEQHGGEIFVKGGPTGTTLVVKLPLISGEPDDLGS